MARENKKPRHVAIIMDGNGRWATSKGLPRFMGHRAGMDAVRRVIEAAKDLGVQTLTLFAFSTENWKRPTTEINALMTLLVEYLHKELPRLMSQGVRFHVMGDKSMLPHRVRTAILQAEDVTKNNTSLNLNLALSYGGRWDILQATKGIAQLIQEGSLSPEMITEEAFAGHLASAHLGDPDLIIRASGELRLSNFYLWQAAYAEIWSTPVFWPDFGKEHLKEALDSFCLRDRRYGEVGKEGPES